jgi:hypothetical protein
MAEKKTVKDNAAELRKIKHHIALDKLEVNKIYHIPPILTIERMDIQILGVDGDDIKFKRVDSTTDKAEKSMKKSSILSRFLVKKLGY